MVEGFLVAAKAASGGAVDKEDSGSTVQEMWRNVKLLEEENKRLHKERQEWVDRALDLSKRLHDARVIAAPSGGAVALSLTSREPAGPTCVPAERPGSHRTAAHRRDDGGAPR